MIKVVTAKRESEENAKREQQMAVEAARLQSEKVNATSKALSKPLFEHNEVEDLFYNHSCLEPRDDFWRGRKSGERKERERGTGKQYTNDGRDGGKEKELGGSEKAVRGE